MGVCGYSLYIKLTAASGYASGYASGCASGVCIWGMHRGVHRGARRGCAHQGAHRGVPPLACMTIVFHQRASRVGSYTGRATLGTGARCTPSKRREGKRDNGPDAMHGYASGMHLACIGVRIGHASRQPSRRPPRKPALTQVWDSYTQSAISYLSENNPSHMNGLVDGKVDAKMDK